MKNYIVKKSFIQAVQFDPIFEHKMNLPAGVDGRNSPGADNWAYLGCEFWIPSPRGRLTLLPGDFIVKADDGQLYPVHPTVFKTLYQEPRK